MAEQSPPCPKETLPNGTPELPDAGKLSPAGNTVASCLKETPRPVTPTAVRKFRKTTDPAPGAKIIFYGSADDPDVATHLTHGIKSTSQCSVASLISPVAKSEFQEKMQDMKEAIYFSNREAPLGKSHDQSLKLPEGLDIIKTTFGIKFFKDLTAGELVNPPKTFEEVDKEAREGHDLYVLSHEDYYAGESVNRKYNSHFDKSFVYGMETPHYEDGRNTAKTFNWVLDLDSKRAPHLVSKRSDDFKEKYQPLIGKVFDPIADTMNVPPDHTFGLAIRPDEYDVHDLLHVRVPCEFLRGKDRERVILIAVRESLKKANYGNFNVLLEALRHFDKNGDGMIHKEKLRKIFSQLNVNLDDELLESLFDCCDLDKDGLINYRDFANFLNWKDKMGVKEFEEKIITKGYPLCGVPSIRSDIPAPQVCRLSDTTNYGDQGSSFSLLYPSVFSQKGVYEKHLLKKRPKAEIKQILHNMGMNASDERFEEIWKQVCTKHEIKELCDCEESMWNILSKICESGIEF
ncbi:EF-hand domain-containing family member B isoform X3 [Agelaius tricolor]|uniref:EF-hand domain-containing family member B isoform X3 n=1 Tax=Agelaius tricolor TaxID=9191 RepID=UPI0039F22A53